MELVTYKVCYTAYLASWKVCSGNSCIGKIHQFKEDEYQYWPDGRKRWGGRIYTTLIDCKKSLEEEIK